MSASDNDNSGATMQDALALAGFLAATLMNLPTIVGWLPVPVRIFVLLVAFTLITWASRQYIAQLSPRWALSVLLSSGIVGLILASIPGNLLDPRNLAASRYEQSICRLGLRIEIGDDFQSDQVRLRNNPFDSRSAESSYYVSSRGHAFKCRAFPDGTLNWSARGGVTISATARWRIEGEYIVVESFLKNGKLFDGYKMKTS